jgi:hypothetical protein
MPKVIANSLKCSEVDILLIRGNHPRQCGFSTVLVAARSSGIIGFRRLPGSIACYGVIAWAGQIAVPG